MEVTLLEVSGASSPVAMRVRVGGAERHYRFKVGQPLLLPYYPSPTWPSTPRSPGNVMSPAGGAAKQEPLRVEVMFYQRVGSEVLHPLPGGGMGDGFTPLASHLCIPIRRTGSSTSLNLRVHRGVRQPEKTQSQMSGSDDRDERRNLQKQWVQSLVQDVLRDRPADPRRYLLDHLRRLRVNGTQSLPATEVPRHSALQVEEPQTPASDVNCSHDDSGAAPQEAHQTQRSAAQALAHASDRSASLRNALTPLTASFGKRDGSKSSPRDPGIPRPPESPRNHKAPRGGRSFVHGIASRLFGGASTSGEKAATNLKPPANEQRETHDASPRVPEPERNLSQVQTEARFSLALILRGPACSAAAETSLREKVQHDIAESYVTNTIRVVRERLISEHEAGLPRRRSRPATASRRSIGAPERNSSQTESPSSGATPTPIVFLNHSSNWSRWLN
eukprot:TRINITY_DN14325_c0_g3_i1.p1 TRINITY_DN14325_c0_g3~~TRINITY_DN14325_c0_g3_i1.p1  ORF type:complete len:447 (+),score=62.99 TRINITY_DN14325_c0_g3_i1:99-1439(+)